MEKYSLKKTELGEYFISCCLFSLQSDVDSLLEDVRTETGAPWLEEMTDLITDSDEADGAAGDGLLLPGGVRHQVGPGGTVRVAEDQH